MKDPRINNWESSRSDSGVSAVWVAVVALFLMASAALAVDVSGAFQTARTDQTTADLSCLAGVKELPEDQDAAIDIAAAYVQENWGAMSGAALTKTLPTASLDDGQGNVVVFDTTYGGDNTKMQVRVTEQAESWFGKVIGTDAIPVTQEAWCRVDEKSVGGGGLPFGAAPGGFNGNLQKLNPCETGNCGPLFIDRDDVSGTGPILIKNIADGPDRKLAEFLGFLDGTEVDCNAGSTSSGDTCQLVDTDTGVSAGHLGEGLLQRLEKLNGNEDCTDTFNGREFNCDTRVDILVGDGDPNTIVDLADLASPPIGWDDSLHGDWGSADKTDHYYYDGEIAKCDSVRLGFMPIVSEDMDWDLGDAPPPFPNGNKEVKIVGFYWVIIRDPNAPSDWVGSGNLKRSSADIIWFGPNAHCPDEDPPFDPLDPTLTSKDVLLVNETN